MRSLSKFSTSLLFTCLPLLALAAASHQRQSYHVSANKAAFNRKNHTAIFSGAAKLTQGSSVLQGNKIELYFDKANKKIIKLVDYGKPAKYSIQLNNKTQRLRAQAAVIHYYPKNNLVTLTKNAEARQGQDKITGDYMTYDLKEQIIKAKPLNNNSRTLITLQPQDLKT